ncbi:alanine racemase [Microbacterium sp. STN6]|uniref:alanine racemase n=1 Tax=Microbacterium sp. STN6 TaxID=2995588 RepID=UPI002260A6AA|nr:alanine racemase [Microbacterium sp. STN6]MCX7523251.1 alanine racemase [Microbacterium sp. STN6]
MSGGFREASIDLAAIRRNVQQLRRTIGTEHTMAVVKANGYGHGAVPSAQAALAGGADWLGVADVTEALELRAGGVDAPILAWLHEPDADFGEAVAAGIDIGVSSARQLRQAADAAERVRGAVVDRPPAFVHLKLETGLGRNGVSPEDWAAVCAEAAALERTGVVRVRGVFSHLSNASAEDDNRALDRFDAGLGVARAAGLAPELVHVAATAAALRLPRARYNTVRLGIGIYGLSPFDDADSASLGLTPAMTLGGRIAAVRRVEAGAGVSYDYTYRTSRETTLALVPLGYAEGIPRAASNGGAVWVNGRTYAVAGRVAMDQFVLDVGDAEVSVGDAAVLFGDPATGVPAVEEWARAAGTINYEIVTRIGPRVERRYVGR